MSLPEEEIAPFMKRLSSCRDKLLAMIVPMDFKSDEERIQNAKALKMIFMRECDTLLGEAIEFHKQDMNKNGISEFERNFSSWARAAERRMDSIRDSLSEQQNPDATL